MVLIMVAVRDSAVDAFMRPFFVPTTGFAVRSFQDEVKNPESPMAKHPGDFALYELGTFDEDTGRCNNLSAPRQLVRAVDLGDK